MGEPKVLEQLRLKSVHVQSGGEVGLRKSGLSVFSESVDIIFQIKCLAY